MTETNAAAHNQSTTPDWSAEELAMFKRYPWDCECGESHKTASSAVFCDKGYCPDIGRKATNRYTGEVLTMSDVLNPGGVDRAAQEARADALLATYYRSR